MLLKHEMDMTTMDTDLGQNFQEEAALEVFVVIVIVIEGAEVVVLVEQEMEVTEVIVDHQRKDHNLEYWFRDFHLQDLGKILKIICVKLEMFVSLMYIKMVQELLNF